jgi:hypothetical protein
MQEHGCAVGLDADRGEGEIALDASDLSGLHPLFAARLALWIDRQEACGTRVAIKEPSDEATRRLFRAFRLGSPIGGIGEALAGHVGRSGVTGT